MLLFAALNGVLGLFMVFDWNAGPVRGAMLLVLFLVTLWVAGSRRVSGRDRAAPSWVNGLVVLALLMDLGFAGYAISRSARTGKIPLDEGQTSSTAAQLLIKGVNPYGADTLVDVQAYLARLSKLAAVGVVPQGFAEAELPDAAETYAKKPDPQVGRQLLPQAEDPGPAKAARAQFGYKYGPVPMLAATALVAIFGPASVMALNALACFALFGVIALILRHLTPDRAIAGLALAMILTERNLTWNFLNSSATDIWPLLFGAIAVWARLDRRPATLGVALALALGSKLFPSLLYLPLLLMPLRLKAIVSFTVVLTALYLPWVVWDAYGLVHNLLLWPLTIGKDSTAWLYSVGDTGTWAARAVCALVIAWVWWRQLAEGDPAQLPLTFALVALATVVAGGVFHNNYVPWFAVWLSVALAVRIGGAPPSFISVR